MNHIKILFAFLILSIGCNKEDDSTPTMNPPDPETECLTCPEENETDYKVLNGYIGTWDGSTILSADGNIVSVGRTTGWANKQMIAIKTNTAGEEIFSKVFHQIGSEALGVYEDYQQNLYVVGKSFSDNSLENRNLAVAKLDIDGNTIWENNYHTDQDITGYHIAELNENELIVSGSKDGDLVFLKIDSLGQEKSFNIISTSAYQVPSSMLILQDGNVLITGYSGTAIQLNCYDQDANLLWNKSYDSNMGLKIGRSTIQLVDGSLITVGKHTHTHEGTNHIDSSKVVVLKTNETGELIWEKEAGDIFYLNDGQSIAVNEDGKFVVTGYASSNFTETDHMLIYLDEEGNEINSKYYTDDKTFRGANIVKIENDRNVITGGYQGGIFFLNVDNYGL